MKKTLLAMICLVIVSTAFAFTKGTINPGGNLSVYSIKADSEDKATTVVTLSPQFGRFFRDNVSLDFLLGFTLMSEGGESISEMAFGGGGRFYQDVKSGYFYEGLGIKILTQTNDLSFGNSSVSYQLLDLKAGYLIPVAKNIYIDLGLNYDMGLGSYSGDGSGDNEQSQLTFNAGFQLFIKK